MKRKRTLKAGIALTVLMLASVQTIGGRGESFIYQASASPENQTTPRNSDFGEYRIVRRLSRPDAPLGGGRAPYPKLVFEDRQGRFWICDDRGGQVQLYDERTGQWDLFKREPDSERIHHHAGALLPLHIEHISQSRDGIVWFSAASASPEFLKRLFLTSFDGKQWRSFPFAATSNGSMGLIQGIDGRVWFWAVDELRYWDRGRWSEPVRIPDVVKEYPETPHTSSSADQSAGQQNQTRDRTRYGIIAGMQDQKGYLWLSTHCGIITYDPRTGKLQKYPDLKDERAHSVYEDHQGRIWFNEIFEVVVYNRSNGAIKRYKPLDHIARRPDAPDDYSLINGICQDRRGRMLFVFTEGVSIFNEIENRWSFTPTKALGLDVEGTVNDLKSIMEDSQGRIWLSGFTGIAILDQSVRAPMENRGQVPRNLRVR